MQLRDLIPSIIRTISPFIVGAVAAYFARKGITFDNELINNLKGALDVILGALYYIAVRLLEMKYPKAGLLLLMPKQPLYVPQMVAPGQSSGRPEEVPPSESGPPAPPQSQVGVL